MDTPKKDSRCLEDGKMLIEGRIEMVRLETSGLFSRNFVILFMLLSSLAGLL